MSLPLSTWHKPDLNEWNVALEMERTLDYERPLDGESFLDEARALDRETILDGPSDLAPVAE